MFHERIPEGIRIILGSIGSEKSLSCLFRTGTSCRVTSVPYAARGIIHHTPDSSKVAERAFAQRLGSTIEWQMIKVSRNTVDLLV